MAYGKDEVVARVYERLLDWLDDCSNTGGNVTNLALDLLNRAQEELRTYRRWSDLVTTSELTISSRQATLPDDCGEIVRVFEDTDGDGLPERFWWLESKRPDDGYTIRDAFDKSTGHSRTITFYTAPSSTTYLKYIKALEDFEAADVDTDESGYAAAYSFFPNALLMARAQLIHVREGGVPDTNEMKIVQDTHDRLMTDYEQAHQWANTDMRMEILDDQAMALDIESYDLLNGSDGASSPYGNDYDQG